MKRIPIYLDTNMIHDIFIRQVKAMKMGEKHPRPKKYEFMIENQHKLKFITSVLTKAEIVRELCSAFGLNEKDIEKLWNDFQKSLKCKYIGKFTVDEKLVNIVMKLKMRLRTMMNFQHVFVAMKENAYFVSGDKDIVKKIKENDIYTKSLTYVELRELIKDV